VTVIATGFENKKNRRLGLGDLDIRSIVESDDLDIPAFFRRK